MELEARLRAFLLETRGQFMCVEFVKRTTGEVRRMNCRTGVRAHLKDPGAAPDPKLLEQDLKHDLLRVYDLVKREYRMINLRSVRRITAGGEVFEAEEVTS